MTEITPTISKKNVESVREMISKKQSFSPYYASATTVTDVVTDMDHFPYSRFFRGVYYFPEPIVSEREAGWRPIQNACYQLHQPGQLLPYPNHCYESACSTVYPCYP